MLETWAQRFNVVNDVRHEPIERVMLRQSDDAYEISPIQAGMLWYATVRTGSGVDIEQIVAHLEEPVDIDKLIEGWRQVTQRHPVLRTSFRWLDCPEPLRQVQPQVDLPIVRLDWSDLDRGERNSRLALFLSADRRQGLDLEKAPPARLTFIKIASQVVMVLNDFATPTVSSPWSRPPVPGVGQSAHCSGTGAQWGGNGQNASPFFPFEHRSICTEEVLYERGLCPGVRAARRG
jgi:hypothetical protein